MLHKLKKKVVNNEIDTEEKQQETHKMLPMKIKS